MTNSVNTKYSIIIPTYNTDIVLGECIEALSEQPVERECFEVIVVNDGGKSDVPEDLKLKGNGLNIKYFYQDHKGPAAARNLALDNASGEIILLLDDDSMPTEDWLQSTIKAWDSHSNYDGIGGYVISESTDSIYCRVNADFFNWYLEQQSSEEDCTFLVTCNAGYKRSILNKIGNFDESFKRASGEDRDLNIKISKAGGRMRLDRNILVYHDRDLTFRSFVRKNYNYGKAAYNIYVRYPDHRKLSKSGYIELYTSIIKRYKSLTEKIQAFSLITISQASTLAGYYVARLSKSEQIAN